MGGGVKSNGYFQKLAYICISLILLTQYILVAVKTNYSSEKTSYNKCYVLV